MSKKKTEQEQNEKGQMKPKDGIYEKDKDVELINIANDAGSRGLRLFGDRGAVDVSAFVATNGGVHFARIDGLKRRKPPTKIESENTPPLYVGDNAVYFGQLLENLGHERQTGTPEMRAVLYYALSRYQQEHGAFRKPLRMAVALPNQFLSGDDAERNRQQARWMEGDHEWKADGVPYQVSIAEARPTTQGSAAMFDYLLNERGEWIPHRKDHFKKEIGVISVGFDTVELTVVQNMGPFYSLTRGEKVGARELLRLYDPAGNYSLGELEPLLRAGSLDVSSHLPVWERKVTGFIESVWKTRWRRFAAVVIVGGGVILLRNTLPHYFNGKAFVPDDPVLAVSRGLHKLMLNQFGKKDGNPAPSTTPRAGLRGGREK